METSTINENQSKVNLIKFVEEKYLKNFKEIICKNEA